MMVAGVSRENSLLAKRACVSQEWLNKLEADFSFYGLWNSDGNKKSQGNRNKAIGARL